jgi:hypothetical protein
MAIWLSILAGLVILLLMPLNENSSIFSTNYTLSLVLPVMLGSITLWIPVYIGALDAAVDYTIFIVIFPSIRLMKSNWLSPRRVTWFTLYHPLCIGTGNTTTACSCPRSSSCLS